MNGPKTKTHSDSDTHAKTIESKRSLWLCHELPVIGPEQPMNETAYWAWMHENHDAKETFVESLKAYLLPHGFDIEEHYLPSDVLKLHKSVHNHWWWCKHHNIA